MLEVKKKSNTGQEVSGAGKTRTPAKDTGLGYTQSYNRQREKG